MHSPPRRLGGGVESGRGGCAGALGGGSRVGYRDPAGSQGARAGARPHSSRDFLTVSGRVRPSRHSEIGGAFDRVESSRVVRMMEDRSSPPATTSYYRPPRRAASRVRLRAQRRAPGAAEAARGRGRLLHPPRVLERALDDANGVVSGSASSGRDYGHGTRDMGHGTRGALYTSEVVRDTLNPDWRRWTRR